MKQLSLSLLLVLAPASILAFQQPNDLEYTTDCSDYAGSFYNQLQNTGTKEALSITHLKIVVAQEAQLKSQKAELQEVRGALQRQNAHIDQLHKNFEKKELGLLDQLAANKATELALKEKECEKQVRLEELKSESDRAAFELSSAQFASSQASWKFTQTVNNRDMHIIAGYVASGIGFTIGTTASLFYLSVKDAIQPVVVIPLALCATIAAYSGYKSVTLHQEVQTLSKELTTAQEKESTKQHDLEALHNQIYNVGHGTNLQTPTEKN